MSNLEFFYVESEMDYRRHQTSRPGLSVPRISRRRRPHLLRKRGDRNERSGERLT